MSSSVAQTYHDLSNKFLEVSVREQLLIMFCGLVVVILVLYTFLIEPQINVTQKLQQNRINADKNMTTLLTQVATLSDKLKNDPNNSVQDRIKQLQAQIQSNTRQLETETANLVPANKMAAMLESVLSGSKGLKLIQLQSIAPEPILLEQPEEGEAPQAGLYRHGVTLVFEGSYFDIQQYLENLESLPWQFYWKRFDYQVGEYPNASVELEIYTLSTNKAFIGV